MTLGTDRDGGLPWVAVLPVRLRDAPAILVGDRTLIATSLQ
jgi:hypothetical protein